MSADAWIGVLVKVVGEMKLQGGLSTAISREQLIALCRAAWRHKSHAGMPSSTDLARLLTMPSVISYLDACLVHQRSRQVASPHHDHMPPPSATHQHRPPTCMAMHMQHVHVQHVHQHRPPTCMLHMHSPPMLHMHSPPTCMLPSPPTPHTHPPPTSARQLHSHHSHAHAHMHSPPIESGQSPSKAPPSSVAPRRSRRPPPPFHASRGASPRVIADLRRSAPRAGASLSKMLVDERLVCWQYLPHCARDSSIPGAAPVQINPADRLAVLQAGTGAVGLPVVLHVAEGKS